MSDNSGIGIVVQSETSGGAEKYLNSLYVAGGPNHATVLGALPGWTGDQIDIELSPKWSRKTMLRGLLQVPKERRELSAAIEGRDFGAFHLQFKREQLAFTKMLSKKAPVVWTEHGQFTARNRIILGSAYARAARHVAAIICVSDAVADDVQHLVGPRVRIEVIRNTVDLGSFKPGDAATRTRAKNQLSVPVDAPVIAWVGRMASGKLPLLALRATSSWDGYLLLAGTGELEAAVREEGKNRPKTKVLGFCDPRPVLEAADVFLFTSEGKGEGLPISIVEACASGLNVVSNRGSGLSALVEEFGGEVVDDNADPSVWREAFLRQSAQNKRDSARFWAESIGGVAQWRAEHWIILESVQKD